MRYYYIAHSTSRNAPGGARYSVHANVSDRDIIEWARNECVREGRSLEEFAGIDFVCADTAQDAESCGEWVPARDWEEGEEFESACEKLSDDGRYFYAYAMDDTALVNEFLELAEDVGLGDRAREIVHAVR